jgi:uncharacterized membrane protein
MGHQFLSHCRDAHQMCPGTPGRCQHSSFFSCRDCCSGGMAAMVYIWHRVLNFVIFALVVVSFSLSIFGLFSHFHFIIQPTLIFVIHPFSLQFHTSHFHHSDYFYNLSLVGADCYLIYIYSLELTYDIRLRSRA